MPNGFRVYASFGKGDHNKAGFSKKSDAQQAARRLRQFKGVQWVSVKPVKNFQRVPRKR